MFSTNSLMPIVLCVGGSDPSAHAGLQADIRVGQDLGVHIVTVVTSLTAQNSQGVSHVFPIAKQQFDAQWESILSDMQPNIIKIGLLSNYELMLATSFWLKKIKIGYPDCQIVLDPVGVSSTGQSLFCSSIHDEAEGHDSFESLMALLTIVDWITPNTDEFALMVNLKEDRPIIDSSITSRLFECFNAFMVQSPSFREKKWLIKGGHAWGKSNASEDCVDWLFTSSVKVEGLSFPIGFSSKRQTQSHSRGTGCSFATALSAFLSLGYDTLDSITLAKSYINHALEKSYQVGKGEGPLGTCGWPDKIEHLPEILTSNEQDVFQSDRSTQPFLSMEPRSFGLYPVVDSPEWIERLLKAGIQTIQLRIKNPQSPCLDQNIKTAVKLGKRYSAQVFINDYWQKAIEYGAYGVHLGQEDLLEADLAYIAASGLRLGVSTHGYFEIARAQNVSPSYIALGHIFPTKTKDMPSQPQGIERLTKYIRLLSGVYPTVAIGGIGEAAFDDVLQTNVDGIAMVTAITESSNPEAVVTGFLQRMSSYNVSRKRMTV
ncbi:thiamine phosphate synthase [Marinomonas sp. 2405UD68-3]|uniref:thiamine phosphate synthase n=1 Tax=Marinomonas sp. 2405UD68-3 TaxID=3391835 RepID=UPI0039C9B724